MPGDRKAAVGNNQLTKEVLELWDELLSCTGLPRQMHRIDVKIKQRKSLLIRAVDTLESDPSDTHFQLVQELPKAAQ